MKKILKKYHSLLRDYGTYQYILASGDVYLVNIPEQIAEVWYSESKLSFRSVAKKLNDKSVGIDVLAVEVELLEQKVIDAFNCL